MKNLNTTELLGTPNGTKKAKELLIRALINTEVHHKQWYLEKALEALGVDLNKLPEKRRGDIGEDNGDENWPWLRGIAP